VLANRIRWLSAPPQQLLVDNDGSLADRAVEFRLRVAQLQEERICAREHGMRRDRAYMEDLERELAATLHAYAGAVILQLAWLRAAIDGRRRG
jgi:hypothetical protein